MSGARAIWVVPPQQRSYRFSAWNWNAPFLVWYST